MRKPTSEPSGAITQFVAGTALVTSAGTLWAMIKRAAKREEVIDSVPELQRALTARCDKLDANAVAHAAEDKTAFAALNQTLERLERKIDTQHAEVRGGMAVIQNDVEWLKESAWVREDARPAPRRRGGS